MINQLQDLSDCARVICALELEYGYVLSKLKNVTSASILEVSIDKVKLANEEYKKISKDEVEHYVDYKLPRAVCTENGGSYMIIDGYHRMISAQNKKDETVKIIVLE